MRPEIDPAVAAVAAPFEALAGRRLTLLLHGFGADERDLLPLARTVPDDVVIAPRAPYAVGPGSAWVDGPPEVVLAGTGLDATADALLRFVDGLAARAGTPDEVRLLGFSQGGALALTALRRAPRRIARVVVLSGFVPATDEPGDAALARLRPPVLWVRGEADRVVPAEVVARTAAWLPAHADATAVVVPGLGHGVDARALEAVARFLA